MEKLLAALRESDIIQMVNIHWVQFFGYQIRKRRDHLL